MAERIMWDKYEAAVLLEAVLKIEDNSETKNDAIERVSKQLRSMAQNRGLAIDDTYRNTNGISMQMAAMKATAFDIESKMRSHSKVFCEIVEQGDHFVRRVAVKRRKRLVKEQNFRIMSNGTTDCKPLFHTAGHFAYRCF